MNPNVGQRDQLFRAPRYRLILGVDRRLGDAEGQRRRGAGAAEDHRQEVLIPGRDQVDQDEGGEQTLKELVPARRCTATVHTIYVTPWWRLAGSATAGHHRLLAHPLNLVDLLLRLIDRGLKADLVVEILVDRGLN